MDLTGALHLVAGIAALGLGAGAFLRRPDHRRNRLFALLCTAIAVWNLGVVGELTAPALRWGRLFLLGACAAAPLGVHLALVVAGASGSAVRVLLFVAYVLAGTLWGSVWTPLYQIQPGWNFAAAILLGSILAAGLWVFLGCWRALPSGPERSALRLLIGAGAVGVIGGLSDFLPRQAPGFPKLGPAAVLLFLLIVCAVVVRHRFLDVDVFLARALALFVGSAAAALLLFHVARVPAGRLLPLYLATFLIVAVAGPAWRALLYGVRALFGPTVSLADALATVSRQLPMAGEPGDVRRAIEEASRALPEDVRAGVYLRDEPHGAYRLAFRTGPGTAPMSLPGTDVLPWLLEREGRPVTRHFLEAETRDSAGERRALAAAAARQMSDLEAELAVPFFRHQMFAGWVGVGGGHTERYLTAEVASALMAVGNQAVASLDRIQAQELARRREALAAVGEMAAGLAHEVRNPLAAIHGAAQALAVGMDARKAREMLDIIEEESGRLGRVVSEFLEYARPGTPRRQPVDVGDLARRVLRAAEAAGSRPRAELRIAEGTPPALADADQLQRAMGNLVRNAQEAAGPDGSLRLEVARDGSGRVRVRFEDDGPGIPPEQMARLFQPFYTTKPGGTGLGLALVHRVVEAHGGEVSVDGRPGRGAVFTIVLPAAEGAA